MYTLEKSNKRLIEYVINGKSYKVTLREAKLLDKAFIDGKNIGYRECVEETSRLLNRGIGSLLASLIPTRKSWTG